jgi:hypothetical protein
MVDSVVAISLAKPSKPVDEEKFALLLSVGSSPKTLSLWKRAG